MPIYEYVCRKCGEELERLQKLSDEPLTECPECGEPTLKRRVSAAAFRLSGGGWYETDFKSDGRRNIAGNKSESSNHKSSRSSGNSGEKAEPGKKKKSDTKAAESKASPSKASASKGSDST